MPSAKEIVLKPIDAKTANAAIKKWHYSGKVVNNSQFHIGAYLHGRLEGAMSFGPSLDKRKIMGLVESTGWNEFIELNRMAFSDVLPRNSESRCISVAMRILKTHASHLKWVISFADATQCGDGAIYRASGFVLTGIKRNNQIWEAPGGEIFNETSVKLGIGGERERERAKQVFSRTSLTDGRSKQQQQQAKMIVLQTTKENKRKPSELDTGASSMAVYRQAGWKPKTGFQLRYLYFLDPTARERLTVPILPFSDITRYGASMYKGKPSAGNIASDVPAIHAEKG